MSSAESDSQLPKADDVIAGKYHVVRMLGEGGMGVVYEAVHKRLRQRVAIKMILPRLLKATDFVARFEREARAASQIRGPNVARVIDVDVLPNGVPYMVMEYLEGNDLSAELRNRGRLPIAEAVGFVLDACTAMHEAHSMGIIHRDLKPSNLFLCGEGGRRIVKVLDFGISKMTSDSDPSVTATETTIGTPLYMSPEQIRSAKRVDGRTDIWALGVILYELVAGRTPFTGGATAVAASIVADEPVPLRAYRAEAPDGLEAVVMKALTKDMKGRHENVADFAAALRPFADASWAPLQSTDGAGGMRSSPSPSVPSGVDRPSNPSLDTASAPTQLHFALTPTERAATTPAAIVRAQTSAAAAAAAVTPPPNSATASIPPPRSRKGVVIGVLVAVPIAGLVAFLAIPRQRVETPLPVTGPATTTSATVATATGPATSPASVTATIAASASATNIASAATTSVIGAAPTGKPTAKATVGVKPPASVTTKPTSKPTAPAATPTPTTDPTIPVHI